MNEGAAGFPKKSHAGDNREIPPFKKEGRDTRPPHPCHPERSMNFTK